jgi:alpha-beta hydrolase superfamily lysophospholipase
MFVHGMWLHASSWRDWIDVFAAHGFDASAPAWPGEHPTAQESRAHAADQAGVSMDRLVTHFAEVIRELPVPPILIGHSLGGTVVQKLLAAGYGVGGVVLDSARFDGELPGALATLRVGLPALADAGAIDDAIALTDYQFRFAFGRSLDKAESDDLFAEFAMPAPARLLLEPETAGIDLPAAPGRKAKAASPLLVVESSAAGATAAPGGSLVGSRRSLHDGPHAAAQPARFPDRGTSFVFDSGWRDVAECVLDWVQDRFGSSHSSSRGVALRGTAA